MCNKRLFIPLKFERTSLQFNYKKSVSQIGKVPFLTVPDKLVVERTIHSEIRCSADNIIRGFDKWKSGSYKFFTGLAPVPNHKRWYCGDHPYFSQGKKNKSLVIFNFSPDYEIMWVFYFPDFDAPSQEQRKIYAQGIIPHLKEII